MNKIWVQATGIFVAAQVLLLLGLGQPAYPYFDERAYVAAARQILAAVPNANIEHPPLGKTLIALSLWAAGDAPFGWRVLSTTFGALTLAGIFVGALSVLGTRRAAWLAVLVTVLNEMWLVESRMAVIDVFMAAFLVWALVAYTRRWWYGAGVLFALAAACKWSAVPAYGFCLVLLFWRRELTHARILLAMVLVPLVVYFLSFAPYFVVGAPGYHVSDFWMMQTNIWTAQMQVPWEHPYHSPWYEWPLLLKPIWYTFAPDPAANTMRGILFTGNLMLSALGLVGLGVALYRRQHLQLVALYLVLWLYPWILIERKAAYLYYYYPASLVLGLGVAYLKPSLNASWIAFLALAAGVFIIYLPFLTGRQFPLDFFNSLSQWLPPVYVFRL